LFKIERMRVVIVLNKLFFSVLFLKYFFSIRFEHISFFIYNFWHMVKLKSNDYFREMNISLH
jgi:hypothetical protein